MAWPTLPTGTLTNGIVGQGDVTYMRWGTKDAVTTTGFFLIQRISQRPKKEDFESTNGDGIQSGRLQMMHGNVWDVTVRDRTDMVPPRVGQYVTIVDLGGLLGALNAAWAYRAVTAYVLESNYEAAPKQPGERTIVLERITLIEGA